MLKKRGSKCKHASLTKNWKATAGCFLMTRARSNTSTDSCNIIPMSSCQLFPFQLHPTLLRHVNYLFLPLYVYSYKYKFNIYGVVWWWIKTEFKTRNCFHLTKKVYMTKMHKWWENVSFCYLSTSLSSPHSRQLFCLKEKLLLNFFLPVFRLI